MRDAAIFILITIAIIIFLNGCIETGKGEATDSIADVSYEGIIFKTWRVQLVNDHPTEYDNARYGIVSNQSLLRQIEEYQNTGQRVKLKYTSYLFVMPWDYSDDEVVYEVILIDNQGEAKK